VRGVYCRIFKEAGAGEGCCDWRTRRTCACSAWCSTMRRVVAAHVSNCWAPPIDPCFRTGPCRCPTLPTASPHALARAGDRAHEEMRQACFDYLSLGGIYSSGPIALLSGLCPSPSVLVMHFFMVRRRLTAFARNRVHSSLVALGFELAPGCSALTCAKSVSTLPPARPLPRSPCTACGECLSLGRRCKGCG
jgi:hypothetical protein